MGTVGRATPVGIRAQEARISQALMRSRVLVFGNVQGNTHAIRVVTDVARAKNIPTIVSLGRFTRGDCKGNDGEILERYLDNYRLLLRWVNEAPQERLWVGVLGKYDYMPDGKDGPEILEHVTFDGTTEQPIWLYQGPNLFFAHFSDDLCDTYRAEGFMPRQDVPTVLFFSHSYYMGINEGASPISPRNEMSGPFQIGEIRRQEGKEPSCVHLPPYEVEHRLLPGRTYWVSTGGNFLNQDYNEFRNDGNQYVMQVVNFAVYDPTTHNLTLKSLSEWQLHWRRPPRG